MIPGKRRREESRTSEKLDSTLFFPSETLRPTGEVPRFQNSCPIRGLRVIAVLRGAFELSNFWAREAAQGFGKLA